MTIAGTGSAIDFGLQTGIGIYTVSATNATTGCSKTMTGRAVIGLDPTIYTMTGGGAECTSGTAFDIGLSGSDRIQLIGFNNISRLCGIVCIVRTSSQVLQGKHLSVQWAHS